MLSRAISRACSEPAAGGGDAGGDAAPGDCNGGEVTPSTAVRLNDIAVGQPSGDLGSLEAASSRRLLPPHGGAGSGGSKSLQKLAV